MAGDGFTRTARNTARNVAANQGDVPWLRLLLGLLLIGFFLLALMLQIQTSEAFILNGAPVTLSADWGILRQPWDLMHGQLPLGMAKAVIWGWGIELVYLVCVVGGAAVHGRLSGLFKTGALLLIIFDFWTDLNYGTIASGIGGQIAFAAITSFMVAFFGTIGIKMVFSAILEMV